MDASLKKIVEPGSLVCLALLAGFPSVIKLLDGTTRQAVLLSGALAAGGVALARDPSNETPIKTLVKKIIAISIAQLATHLLAKGLKRKRFTTSYKGLTILMLLNIMAVVGFYLPIALAAKTPDQIKKDKPPKILSLEEALEEVKETAVEARADLIKKQLSSDNSPLRDWKCSDIQDLEFRSEVLSLILEFQVQESAEEQVVFEKKQIDAPIDLSKIDLQTEAFSQLTEAHRDRLIPLYHQILLMGEVCEVDPKALHVLNQAFEDKGYFQVWPDKIENKHLGNNPKDQNRLVQHFNDNPMFHVQDPRIKRMLTLSGLRAKKLRELRKLELTDKNIFNWYRYYLLKQDKWNKSNTDKEKFLDAFKNAGFCVEEFAN